MTTSEPPAPAPPLPARCVDCGQEIPDAQIFRVLRRDRAGQRHVVCHTCGDRRHAQTQPAPLQVQRTPPPRPRPTRTPPGDQQRQEVAVVARWHRLLNSAQIEALMALIHPDVEVGGPRGVSRGAQTFREWCGRAGVRLVPRRYFHRDAVVVVEEDAQWPAPDDAQVERRHIVASIFTVEAGIITRVSRFDTLVTALDAAGLTAADAALGRADGDPGEDRWNGRTT